MSLSGSNRDDDDGIGRKRLHRRGFIDEQRSLACRLVDIAAPKQIV
jgi:hypothetical protein